MSHSVSRDFLTCPLAAVLMSAVTLPMLVLMDSQAFCYLCLLILHYTDGCAVTMVTFLSNQCHRFKQRFTLPVNLTLFGLAQPVTNTAVFFIVLVKNFCGHNFRFRTNRNPHQKKAATVQYQLI